MLCRSLLCGDLRHDFYKGMVFSDIFCSLNMWRALEISNKQYHNTGTFTASEKEQVI